VTTNQVVATPRLHRCLRVFLCHSSANKPEVRNLYHRLKGHGYGPWLDEEDLVAGQEWEPEIRAAVRRSDVVVVCLSHASINKEGFVQKEIKLALDVEEEKPPGTIFMIPLRLDEVEVPARLARWHWINFFQPDGFERLRAALDAQASLVGIERNEDKGSGTDGLNWRCGIYDYPPLSSWPEHSETEPSGPLVWLARHIAEEVGKVVAFELFAYDDFYKVNKRTPDMIAGMFETKRRSAHVVFSRSIYEIGLQGICRRKQKGDVLQGLRNGDLRVAVYSGEVGWEFVEDELPDAGEEHRVVTLAGGHQMHTIVMLTKGDYDVVIMDYLSCFNFLREKGHRRRFRLAFDEPPTKYRACIALKNEHASYLPAIDEAITKVRNAASFVQIEQTALLGFERVIERRALRSH
jgi:hypothetical protein